MKKKKHIISAVLPGSIADELELEPGDVLVSMEGVEIEDILDYQFYAEDSHLTMVVRKPDGEEWELEIDKEYGENLGLSFENGLMDEYRSCSNKCIFCFIDQMPPGMRDTLYFKDDDARLSFLQGNYITLTNMKEKDMERVVKYHLSPINVSVHTTNPELRCQMLHNRFAGEALKKIDYFYQNEIEMNGQIVLCKNYNDGAELERSLHDLMKYCPVMRSVSVVPVGLSKYREGLCELEPFTKEDALQVIAQIERVQQICMEQFGLHFVHASDEFYLLAEMPVPEEERYDGYLQLENGVGMIRLLIEETDLAIQSAKEQEASSYDLLDLEPEEYQVTIATGKLAYPFLCDCAAKLEAAFDKVKVQVIPITNEFFGERITVSGLITGQDLKKQLTGKIMGSRLLIPLNMLRSGEEVFLDDITVAELSEHLGCPVIPVETNGYDLVSEILGICTLPESNQSFRPYELDEEEYVQCIDLDEPDEIDGLDDIYYEELKEYIEYIDNLKSEELESEEENNE